MSPLTVSIDRCRSAIRLRRDAAGDRTRLTQLHRAALGEPLELALEAAGLRDDRLVCIRRLQVSLRLAPAATDAALTLQLAHVVAHALVEASERGDAVVYRSRAQAVADLVVRTTDGDDTRVWAWRQLGLWEDAAPAPGTAVLLALLGEPTTIVPILAAVAERPPRLRRFDAAVGAGGWRALARAALGAAGAAADLAERARAATVLTDGRERVDRSVPHAPDALEPVRARVAESLRRQPLAVALAQLPAGPTSAQAAAVGLLHADPVLLSRSPRPVELLRTAASMLEEIARGSAPLRIRSGNGSARETEPPAARVQPDAGAATLRRAASASADAPVEAARPATAPELAPPPSASDVGTLSTAATEAAIPLLDDARARGTTAYGGLVFLLHLVPAVVLPRAGETGPLAARSLRWTLGQLARRLVPALTRDDPAALAWAGLPPDAAPPDVDTPEPTADEEAELSALADALRLALCDRLDRSPQEARAALDETVTRRALIVADPGWLEVHLSLDEVTTPVRSAGLDCDPDWLPWLGVVVRLVYE